MRREGSGAVSAPCRFQSNIDLCDINRRAGRNVLMRASSHHQHETPTPSNVNRYSNYPGFLTGPSSGATVYQVPGARHITM